tara:strand:+ start:760 stop:3666 length:2907 start_codon:yes stop_codon:yes gene_type:complete
MSVKSFKFVSPGVFINEIDNSFIPKSADAIGPVVVGRARRGLALQPVSVQSYSEFVEVFGDTVPGNNGGDVYRRGNKQSPMYGTYAAKAFLRSNVAPLTYIRLLGAQHANCTAAGQAGWQTTRDPATLLKNNGGAYGMWVFASGTTVQLGTGSLAAIWYVDSGSSIYLTGTTRGPSAQTREGIGVVIASDVNGTYTVNITSSGGASKKISFNFDDNSELFIRKRFNTNPQLGNASATDFYDAASVEKYFLGETFVQEVRDGVDASDTGGGTDLTATISNAVILPIASGSVGPNKMKNISYNEAVAGWFIGQDLGAAANYVPQDATKLFRLVGRGHGSWLSKNVKVSIEKLRASTSTASKYGTFSVVLRAMHDTDSAVQVLERFDNCNLDPASPNFVARKIGNMYTVWSDTTRRLTQYGEYQNLSKYVYVETSEDVDTAAAKATLLPFGYYGPPKFKDLKAWRGTLGSLRVLGPRYIPTTLCVGYASSSVTTHAGRVESIHCLSGSTSLGNCTGSLMFPVTRLRLSASDGGMADQTNAYFGFQNTRTQTSTSPDRSAADPNRLWLTSLNSDPIGTSIDGVDSYSYIFTLDNIMYNSTSGSYYYLSGSRKEEASYTAQAGNTYKTLIDNDINRYTAPFWGGFDAVNIKKPDPFYNAGMSSATQENSYAYNTWKRAIDTISDPEYINMNLLAAPGLTNTTLTDHMINVCEERADAIAIVDLPSVYIPAHEQKLTKPNRRGTSPVGAANSLRDRQIDSSYGCTFYPWVQTRDAQTGQMLWIPPSVAMLGTFGSSQAVSDVWFAPAGFNRGGLSDGAAGIPVTNVTERLTSKQRDTLYESRINPIASFPSSGIVVFGQKTLQARQSALDRINVRRLVIYLKKQISILSTQILFEQNVQATWNRFKGLIEPFLANVKVQFGITDYRLILDSSTTTPDLIDQNIMYAKIMVKPARAIEYIAIDFVIASTGASFDD